MSSVFRQYLETNNNPNRNTFDWSHQWNGSLQIGKITPVLFDKIGADFSVSFNKIKQSLHFMPLIFPVQTRMKAYYHVFKIRARSLWDEYEDFVCNHPTELEPPYINMDSEEKISKMASTCSLGDYLNLPTVTYGKYADIVSDLLIFNNNIAYDGYNVPYPIDFYNRETITRVPDESVTPETTTEQLVSSGNDLLFVYSSSAISKASTNYQLTDFADKWFAVGVNLTQEINENSESFTFSMNVPAPVSTLQTSTVSVLFSSYRIGLSRAPSDIFLKLPASRIAFEQEGTSPAVIRFSLTAREIRDLNAKRENRNGVKTSIACYFIYKPTTDTSLGTATFNATGGPIPTSYLASNFTYLGPELIQPREITLATSPWYRNDDGSILGQKRIKLSAFPFRAYEAVYNSWFRNIYNNPYQRPILHEDGTITYKTDYNEFIPTKRGGADNYIYELHYRNWEDDFLTTALKTPQQGENPVLVGITTAASADGDTVSFAMQDGSGQVYNIKFNQMPNDEGLASVDYELAEQDSSKNFRSLISLTDIATTGISIPDLRACNALQRWLELNARKGLRYRDHIKGHFGIDIRYDELQMPEFLGGFTKDISMSQVDQMVSKTDNATGSWSDVLGSFAGQAGAFGDMENEIRHFSDETAFILVTCTVVPVANYSQLLPKYWTDRDVLDDYYPEFANISMQPILMQEVAPLQVWKDMLQNGDSAVQLTDTFGYQRPWYQYLSRTDEVHGLMRTQLRDFLINRVFDEAPQLNKEFLLVNPNQVNDVFSVTDVSDKIVGQIWFDLSVKEPIPRNGQPRIEQ